MKNQIKTNFPNLLKAYVDDVVENSKTGNACVEDVVNKENKPGFAFWKSLAFDVSKWQNRFFTLLGILLSGYFIIKSYKTEKKFFFIAFFIGYIIALSGISCGQGDRFHLVTFPFAILLLGKWLSYKDWIKPSSELLQK